MTHIRACLAFYSSGTPSIWVRLWFNLWPFLRFNKHQLFDRLIHISVWSDGMCRLLSDSRLQNAYIYCERRRSKKKPYGTFTDLNWCLMHHRLLSISFVRWSVPMRNRYEKQNEKWDAWASKLSVWFVMNNLKYSSSFAIVLCVVFLIIHFNGP